MKDMKYYFRFLMLALCVSFAACSDDDTVGKPAFPELQEIVCAVGDTKELTFEASDNWTLTSSALWCSFVVDGKEAFSCSGTSGKQTVTIRISNDATELLKSYKANLTLMMKGEKAVVCTVSRPATGYEVNVFNADQSVLYTKENPIVKTYDKNQVFVITANADWTAEPSEGITLDEVYGDAGKTVTVKASLKPGYTQNAWEQKLIFKNRKNEIVSELPVKYEGIPEDRIEFSEVLSRNVKVSCDYKGSSFKIGEKVQPAPLPVGVIAKDDKYVWAYVEYKEVEINYNYEYECKLMSENDSWFWIEDAGKGKLTMMAMTNPGEKRSGYLMIFPKAKYDKIKDNFAANVFDKKTGITTAYEENIAVEFTQDANISLTIGFKITGPDGNPLMDLDEAEITAVSYQSVTGASDEEVIAKYETTNVAILSLPKSKDYNDITFIPNGFSGSYIQLNTYFDGVNTAWSGVSVESAMKEAYITGLKANVAGEKPMTIQVLDGGTVYAVLLVERY